MPRRGERRTATRWFVVGVMIASGVAAALHVGKVPPALPAVREELGLGLVPAGWVASIFNLIGAALGVASGLAADRIGARRVLAAGLVLLACGSTWGASVDTGAALLATRVLSGIGMLAVAVSAPRVIVASATPRDHELALGAWSIYMPAGVAIAMLSAPLVLPGLGWRGMWLLHAGVTAAVLVIVLLATREVAARPGVARGISTEALRRPGAWLLAAAFACYSVQFFAVVTWTPTLLVESHGWSREAAALAGALVVVANIAGNVAGAWLLHRNVTRWRLLAAAFAFMTLCGGAAFSPGISAGLTIAFAAAFSGVGGLLPAAVLAGASLHAPSRDHVATVNGVIVQGSHVGTLIGPPVFAMFVAAFGSWEQGWSLIGIFGLAGLVVTAWIRVVERRLAGA